jgi:DNA polymerase III subunit delta'
VSVDQAVNGDGAANGAVVDADADALPGIERHPHAGAVLGPALAPGGRPSHAYLFHGPAGSGKRAIARGFAAGLLTGGGLDRQGQDMDGARATRERALRGAHPDLTWVSASGAAEMLVGDVDEPVVAAAARTPFESARRVFVIDGAETMNDQAANRLLKTLEEPPSYAHLLLISDRREEVLATIASRCVHVRFDALPTRSIAQVLLEEGVCTDEAHARACAGLALGDTNRARSLAGAEGGALRAAAEDYVRSALAGETGKRSWTELLAAASAAGESAAQDAQARLAAELEFAPSRERRKLEREAQEAGRRVQRRARAGALQSGLQLVELWLRDLVCVQEGAEEVVYAVDRLAELRADAAGCTAAGARRGVELVRETRMRLSLNVGEELALETLAYRLSA